MTLSNINIHKITWVTARFVFAKLVYLAMAPLLNLVDSKSWPVPDVNLIITSAPLCTIMSHPLAHNGAHKWTHIQTWAETSLHLHIKKKNRNLCLTTLSWSHSQNPIPVASRPAAAQWAWTKGRGSTRYILAPGLGRGRARTRCDKAAPQSRIWVIISTMRWYTVVGRVM